MNQLGKLAVWCLVIIVRAFKHQQGPVGTAFFLSRSRSKLASAMSLRFLGFLGGLVWSGLVFPFRLMLAYRSQRPAWRMIAVVAAAVAVAAAAAAVLRALLGDSRISHEFMGLLSTS